MKYEARSHYRDPAVAARYDSQFRRVRRLSDLRAQALGYFETRAFQSLLAKAQARNGLVLDVACGTGRYSRQLQSAGLHVVGADVSPQMLAFARDAAVPDSKGSRFVCSDAAALPFGVRQFEGVTCMRLYHRIPRDVRMSMLREVQRVGVDWAILFFGTTSSWLRIRQGLRSMLRGRPTNPYPMTMTEIEEDLKSVGFQISAVRRILPALASGVVVLVKWK